MSILNTVSAGAGAIAVGGSILSLIPMGKALFMPKSDSLAKGIAGFVFDINLTESVTHSAQITDHYSEDNTYLQDHIAISPMVINLTGKIGELVWRKLPITEFLYAMVNRLSPLSVFTPSQSFQAQQAIYAYELANFALESLERSFNNLKDVFAGNETKTKQQDAYATLEGLFNNRSLITIETPWRTFEDMVIESFSVSQDETTTTETTFYVTCKQMRFVGVQTFPGSLITSRYDDSEFENKGLQRGSAVSGSFMSNRMSIMVN